MLTRPSCLFALALLAVAAAAAPAQDYPFTAVITADKTNVRAGAGQNYYIVGQLSKGDLVEVHDNLYGWFKITPPAGSFSYVAKEYVKVEADGKTGTITGERVRVRAPAPAGPDQSYRTQLMLDTGAKVTVMGDQGQFYKIAPPGEARLFISQEFAARASAEQIAAGKARQAAAEAAVAAPAAVTTTPAAPAAPAAPATAPLTATDSAPRTAVSAPAGPATAPAAPMVTATSAASTPAAPAAPAASSAPAAANTAAPAAANTAAPATELNKPETAPQLVAEVQSDGSAIVDGKKVDVDGFSAIVKETLARAPQTQIAVRATSSTGIDAITSYMNAAKAAGAGSVVSLASTTTTTMVTTTPGGSATPGAVNTPGSEVTDKPASAMSTAERFAELEKRFETISKQPLSEQPVTALRMEYQQIMTAEDLPSNQKRVAELRAELLRTRQDLQNSVAEITAIRTQMIETQKARESADAKKPKSYNAVGRLVASSLYTGDKLPRLYRLVDPLTGLTTAYVQPADPQQPITLTSMLGQYVGVIGVKEYDQGLKLNVITAKEVDVLTPVQQP